jgi:hypothetical protein
LVQEVQAVHLLEAQVGPVVLGLQRQQHQGLGNPMQQDSLDLQVSESMQLVQPQDFPNPS